MTAYKIPPNNALPIVLNSGDTLTVSSGGKSTNVTVQDGATETVNAGMSEKVGVWVSNRKIEPRVIGGTVKDI